jgi:hypothetical protein
LLVVCVSFVDGDYGNQISDPVVGIVRIAAACTAQREPEFMLLGKGQAASDGAGAVPQNAAVGA